MALLKQCFCYSLRQGSFIIGTYSLIVYCVAFALELWWIAEALPILPAPAYTLCGLYFFNFVTAAVLLFGLLVRKQKYLMSWTLTTALSFFPEAGMVLFMSLYYWPNQKYEYGVCELIYWSLRAIFNIFGALCVCSLYLSWRDEELILERLNDLNLAHLGKSNVVGFHNPTLKRHSYSNQSRRLSQHSSGHYYPNKNITLGYQNFGYKLDSPVTISQDINYLTLRPQQPRSRTSQSFTSHVNYIPPNQQSQQRRVGSFRPSLTTLNTEHYPHNGQKSHPTQFNTALMFDPMLRKSRISEWGIAGVGIEPPGFPGTYLQRTKSLWNVKNEDDYWTRAPPSRPVSMGYVNRALQDNSHEVSQSRNGGLTTQVVDTGKRRMVRMGGRRAASMDGLNFNRCYNQNIMANQLTPDWSKSSLESGGEDEEYHYYGRRGEPL